MIFFLRCFPVKRTQIISLIARQTILSFRQVENFFLVYLKRWKSLIGDSINIFPMTAIIVQKEKVFATFCGGQLNIPGVAFISQSDSALCDWNLGTKSIQKISEVSIVYLHLSHLRGAIKYMHIKNAVKYFQYCYIKKSSI